MTIHPPEQPQACPSEQKTLPFAGLVVLEVGSVIAGPFASSLLADLGATVIKVEAPGNGDVLRQMGTRFDGQSVWWGVATRAKKCIALNLKNERARNLFERLVERADVLVENNRPGVLQRLGLGPERLSQLNPAMVSLSISGYGQTGRDAQRPGFGRIAEGLSGVVPLTGDPDQPPLFVGYSLADTAAGLFGAYAVALALLESDVHQGARIDLALYEPMLRMLDPQFRVSGSSIAAPRRQGSNDPYAWGGPRVAMSYPVLQCAQECWVQLDLSNQAKVAKLASLGIAGSSAVTPDELKRWARDKSWRQALDQLAAAGIAAVRIQDGWSMGNEPYFTQRGDCVVAHDTRLGTFPAPGFLPHGYSRGSSPSYRNPEVGQDNWDVLSAFLDVSQDEYRQLCESGAFDPKGD